MTIHTIRDWRGIKVHVSQCTTEELTNMLAHAVAETNHIARFIAEVQAELIAREEHPSDPGQVA